MKRYEIPMPQDNAWVERPYDFDATIYRKNNKPYALAFRWTEPPGPSSGDYLRRTSYVGDVVKIKDDSIIVDIYDDNHPAIWPQLQYEIQDMKEV